MFVITSLLLAILVILISYRVLAKKDIIRFKTRNEHYNHEMKYEELMNDYNKLLKINRDLEKSLEQLKKEKQKAEENDRLKSVFLAEMSHEIRTPMNAILGFSNLLLKNSLSGKNRSEFIRLIIDNGNSLLNLINDIIDVSKIEAEQLKINLVRCNLTELLQDLYLYYDDLIVRSSRFKLGIELKIPSSHKDRNVYIFTDPHRLRQILVNLINNALKFTYEGKIEFGFKINSDNITEFFVKDTGPGIADDKINSIFDRFEQADDPYTKNNTGSGLGLSISKQLVELLGGNIWVKSSEGKGSTFYFNIPSGRATIEKFRGIEKSGKINESYDLSDKSILVAEDEKANFIFIKTILGKAKAKIYWAENGLEAVKICKKKNIDLVLMDIKMPVMNGYDATMEIKSMYPDIPVIAQTAYTMADDINRFIKAGCNGYIIKPIRSSELLEVVHKNLQKVESECQ
jgi:signal transduction histidine kinase/ActR/RegA family two-component response regulator